MVRQSVLDSVSPSLTLILMELFCARESASAAAKSCPTLCDPTDGSPPGSSVPGILQARTLEWVAISFSNACMQSRFSRVRLCATPWTAVHQAPLSTGFSRQEFWSGLPFPSPGSLLGSGYKTETGSNRNPFSDLCSCHFLLFACL